MDRLSKQQRAVLGLLVEGKSNREIGEALGVAEQTVRRHLNLAYDHLGLGEPQARTDGKRVLAAVMWVREEERS